jgi:tRNA threonylcarbamoyladenosine biosynthesis protein TsaE
MQSFAIRTSSEEETIQAGTDLARHLAGVVLLTGDLGAGKTTLVRGIVTGIEGARAEEVSSPTFTLIHDYGAGVFHVDLYRLDRPSQVHTLGLEEIFANACLVLIEWGEKLGPLAPAKRTEIVMETCGGQQRLIRIVKLGNNDAAGTISA